MHDSCLGAEKYGERSTLREDTSDVRDHQESVRRAIYTT